MIGTIDIRGGAELKRALTALSDELRRNVALEALWDGALPIEADMKALAPKDTGKLAQSIHIEAKPGRGDYPMVDVVVGGGLFRGETFYGGFIELGYRRGKRDKNTKYLSGRESRYKGMLHKSESLAPHEYFRRTAAYDRWAGRSTIGSPLASLRRAARATGSIKTVRQYLRDEVARMRKALNADDGRPVVPAKPFVRPAFDKNVETAIGRVLARLQRFFAERAAA